MLKSLLTLSIFAAAVFAQNADIGLSVENQAVQQGSSLIVQVQRPVCSTLPVYLSITTLIPLHI